MRYYIIYGSNGHMKYVIRRASNGLFDFKGWGLPAGFVQKFLETVRANPDASEGAFDEYTYRVGVGSGVSNGPSGANE